MTLRRRASAGFSLVELMVSLAIGLVVVGALIAAYLASVHSGRHTQALIQVADDASAALSLIRQQAAMAGYSRVIGVDAAGLRRHEFPAVFGCESAAFVDPAAGITAGAACKAGAPGRTDTLEVAYEASRVPGPAGALRSNSVLDAAAQPLDCLGNGIAPITPADGPAWYLADAKFYLQDGQLFCHGPGNAAGAPLIENVDDLQVSYGLATPDHPGQVAYYGAAPPAGDAAWDRVLAVSVCLLLRSHERVFVDNGGAGLTGYTDCTGAPRNSTDGYLRRAFSTTIVLNNRMPG